MLGLLTNISSKAKGMTAKLYLCLILFNESKENQVFYEKLYYM